MKAKRRLIGIAIAACAISLFSDPADAAITGQWDFKGGNLQATIGQDMDYLDGDTQARTAFGTTTSFGIPDIGGVAVKVMKFPAAADEFGGYFVPIGAAPNGGGGNVNQYTVIMDVFYPSASSDKVRTLFVSDVNAGSAKLAQRGEVYLDSNNSIVLSEGAGEGTVTAGAWHRIAIAVDATSATSTTVKYIDGVKAGELKTPRGGIDGKFSVYSALNLFNDLETNSQSGFIASLQFQDEKLTDGLLGALGAPVPGGILTTAPPTPYVESLSPSSDLRFPGRSTIVPNPHIEIVLTDGITAVDPTTVKLSINKKSVVPTVNRSAPTTTISYDISEFLPSLSVNSVSLSYQDTAAHPLGVQFSFIVGGYVLVPAQAALPSGSGTDSGFLFNVAQAPAESAGTHLQNSYFRALQQLDGTLLDPDNNPYANDADPSSANVDVIDFELAGKALKAFPNGPVSLFPGIPGVNGTKDNFADETLAYLELSAGTHVFGVDVGIERVDAPPGGDDGYRLYAGANPRDQFSTLVGQFVRTGDNFNDRQNLNEFTFVAPVAGLYPFRLVHWQNNSGANLAWYSVDTATGDKILINDPSDARAILAYQGTSAVLREPYVAEFSPPSGAAGVAAKTPITVVLGDDGRAVKPGSVKLSLNGTVVKPTITKSGTFTTVSYDPNATRTAVTNTVEITYTDDAAVPVSFTQSWQFTIVTSANVEAVVTGQWDFQTGDLSATIGKDLQYLDGPSGQSKANTQFGLTTDLGVPDINGVPTRIMLRKGLTLNTIGYIMDHQVPANGGGQLVNQYTIIFDIFKKGGTTSLFNCQNTNNTTDGSIFWQGNDIGQGSGGYVSKGTATAGAWHRIALAADMGASPPVITKFVDGIKQQDWIQPGLDLPRRSWQKLVLLIADGDNDDMTDTYISSIQVRSGKLTDAQLVILGKPTANKIPAHVAETHVTGQWDFQAGDLSATVGQDLQYLDGPSGQSKANTQFGSTTDLGVPDIDGVPSKIMLRKGLTLNTIGYIMDHQVPANGGGQLVNQYTIIFDIFKKGGTTSLFNCQNTNNTTDGSIFWQGNDIGQGSGGYVSKGTATAGVWHRIALAADMGASPPVITKFVDGIKQQDWIQPGLDLPRRSWQKLVLLIADGDNDDMTDTYLRSVQVSSVKLSDAQLVALGGASSGGIPVALPQTHVTGQWDFQAGDLSATVGKDLQYLDGPSGQSKANTQFGSTTDLGVPDINGVASKIMLRKGLTLNTIGYIMDHQVPANGGGQLVNQYTIIFDIFKKGGTTSLFNCQNTNNTTDGSIFWQGNDIGQGSGGYVSKGTATAGAWHRISLAADMGANPPVITKFVDGIKQQDWIQPGLDLPRRSWQKLVLLIADGDNDDMTDTYLRSIQVSSVKLSDDDLITLGGASPYGIPVVVSQPVSLSIVVSGGSITIAWPPATVGFLLESSDDVANPTWGPVPGVVNNRVTINTGDASAQYFRLRHL